jgi:hypothetical protein
MAKAIRLCWAGRLLPLRANAVIFPIQGAYLTWLELTVHIRKSGDSSPFK